MCAMVGGSQISFANRKSAKLLTYQFFYCRPYNLQICDLEIGDLRAQVFCKLLQSRGKNILNLYVYVGLK
jgi:hypothetical protein